MGMPPSTRRAHHTIRSRHRRGTREEDHNTRRRTHQKRRAARVRPPCGGTVKREVDARPRPVAADARQLKSRLMFRSRRPSTNMQDGAPRQCAMTSGNMVKVEGTGSTERPHILTTASR